MIKTVLLALAIAGSMGLTLWMSVPHVVERTFREMGGDTIRTSFGKILPAVASERQVIAFEQQG